LVESGRARASEILALTFTERAADEMQARVDLLLPYGQADTAIHTFHAFGDWLLREHGFEIGRPADPRVIGRAEAIVLLRDHIFDLGLERYRPLGDPTRFVGAMVDLFARAKEQGVAPAALRDYAGELEAGVAAARDAAEGAAADALDGLLDEAASYRELATAYGHYQSLLLERSLVDHGDQVSEAVRLLEERSSVRLALRRRFRYTVVDEAQDANSQQLRLVQHVAGTSGNIAFVGDDDQAIYSFRGAVGDGLQRLDETYRDMAHVVLRRNYRSRAPILEAARRLIRHNDPHRLEVSHGVDKTLTAVRRGRRPAMVQHHGFPSAVEEADGTAAQIRDRIERGASPGSIAVLVRTNADAAPILASLEVLGVPTRFSGASGLYAHREVRDVISLLRTIASPGVSEDLYAVMTSAPYGIGGSDMTLLCDMASRRRRSLWSVVTEVLEQPGLLRLSGQGRSRLERVVSDLQASIESSHEHATSVVLYEHLRRSGWLQQLVKDAETGDDEPLRRVARLFEIVRDQADLLVDARVAVVAPTLRALMDAGDEPAGVGPAESIPTVAVLTIHQAKGLEFDTVFVVGMADGRFPARGRRDPLELPAALTDSGRSNDQDADRAEERRLFYVAMTRARDELVLSHAASGSRGGRHRRPSIFLSEAFGSVVPDVSITDEPLLLDQTSAAEPVALATRAESGQPEDERPLVLSFTQIDDYLMCPLKYRLRHQVRVPVQPHHALVLGNAIHQAVAIANQARMRLQPVDWIGVEETFRTHWSSEGFLSAEHEEARFASGVSAIERFRSRIEGEPEQDVVAVEQPFSVRIGSDRVRGRYDVVTRTAEGITVTDYKSGDMHDPARARQRARDSLQLRIYALAHEAQHGKLPSAVELHFLEGDVIGRVTPTARQLDSARDKVALAADGIRGGRFEATPGFPACSWCPYRRICPSAA
jgi:DNA helicase-2/ATP-dependent DNA helicase PcrA